MGAEMIHSIIVKVLQTYEAVNSAWAVNLFNWTGSQRMSGVELSCLSQPSTLLYYISLLPS